MKKLFVRALLPTLLLSFCFSANAAILILSDVSSETGETGDIPTPTDVLDATLEFTVVGSQLTLTVTNDTTAPNAFTISEIGFNGSDDVSGLSNPVLPAGWSLAADQPLNGFGTFDFVVSGGAIAPAASVDFVFTILGSGPFDMNDFVSFSSLPPGDTAALAAAKFIQGPGDDSAFGAVVPVPAAVWLFGSALGLLGWMRRRAA